MATNPGSFNARMGSPMPPSQSESRFSVHRRPIKVERVEVVTADIDHNYSRVELSIDGVEFEFSGPDAQVVGAHLNTAGGGDMFVKQQWTDEHDDEVEHRLIVRLQNQGLLKPGLTVTDARAALDG